MIINSSVTGRTPQEDTGKEEIEKPLPENVVGVAEEKAEGLVEQSL